MPGPRPLTPADLEGLERDGLVALWSAQHGRAAPRSISRPMLVRILAFDLQAQAGGGLPRDLARRLAAGADNRAKPRAPRLRPGSRLVREWAGVTHVVDVTADGYLWQGRRWRSLSAIAKVITGAHWSGPRFFGTGAGCTAGAAGRAATPAGAAGRDRGPASKGGTR